MFLIMVSWMMIGVIMCNRLIAVLNSTIVNSLFMLSFHIISEVMDAGCTRARTCTHTHTQLFYGPLGFCPGLPSELAPERENQEGKTNLDFLEQEIVSGSGISWAICKSAPSPRQITMPASHHSVFYRPYALPAAQPTASKH